MKKNPFYNVYLFVYFMLMSLTGFSQTPSIHWTESIENCSQVAPNQLQFSVYLQFDGTTSNIELLAYSFGVNYSTSILNGGNAIVSQVIARNSILNTLSTPVLTNIPGSSTNGGTLTSMVRITQSSKSPGNGVANVNPLSPLPGTKFFLGRFQLETSAATFALSSSAGLNLQCSQQIGRSNSSAVYDIGGVAPSFAATAFSNNPPQPAMSCSSSSSCSTLLLNAGCPLASVSNSVYFSCDSVVVMGSYTNSADSTRWTTDGTGTFVNNTLSTTVYKPGIGEVVATLTFSVYNSFCAVSVATAKYSRTIFTSTGCTFTDVTSCAGGNNGSFTLKTSNSGRIAYS